MKDILFIHGADSSPLSFNYIKQHLPEHNGLDFSYNSNEDVEEIIEHLILVIDKEPKDLNIIGHSLGGVLAVAACNTLKKKDANIKLVAMASPFGGSRAATYLKFLFPGYGLFGNVATTNPVIIGIQNEGTFWPTLNIITSSGESPLFKEANDGVISVSSQLSLKNCTQKLRQVNHFEALLSPQIIDDIKEFLWQ